jgi:tellurite resistance protein
MAHVPHPLKHLLPGWFAVVMGLAGLSLAWYRAAPLMGEPAAVAALVLGVLAAVVFAVLAGATLLRVQRYPEAWADDCRHPVRHTFIATLPVGLILLAAVAMALDAPTALARGLWWLGSIGQLLVTLWVLGRWFLPAKAGGLQWASATPALFIPIVGNVLVPLAGVPLGHADWAAAQFGVGLMFWPVVMGLIIARIAVQGMWPDRLMPTSFIFIAPPAAVGLAALQLGAPPIIGWMLWGMAAFTLLWVGGLASRIAKLPFGLTHWGMSFPLTAVTALTLRLATPGSAMAVLGPVLLALSTLLIGALALATVRGLRDGSLLAPEPLAVITPVAA